LDSEFTEFLVTHFSLTNIIEKLNKSINKKACENYLFKDCPLKACIDQRIFRITLPGSYHFPFLQEMRRKFIIPPASVEGFSLIIEMGSREQEARGCLI